MTDILSLIKKTGIIISVALIPAITSGQSILDYLMRSRALTKAGNTGQSLQLLTRAINDQRDFRLLLERAEVNISTGDFSAAIADLNSANEISEHSGEFGLARVYALKGDASTSMYHLEICMRSGFKRSEKEIMLDKAFSRIENKPEWRQFWKGDWYSVTEENVAQIEYYSSIGKFEDASVILNELRKTYPGSEMTKYAESLVDLTAGRYASAIKILSVLLTSDPDNVKYLRLLAKAQAGQENAAGELQTYSKLLSLNFPDAELLMLRAESYRKTGETDKALADVEKFLSLYPENSDALRLAGKLNAIAGDNLKALQHFSENLNNNPNDPQCYIDRANSYLSARSWEWAIKDYTMALDLNPENSETWLNKGIALLNSGKPEDACYDFKKSFNLGNKKATDYISRNCIK